ncbi:hypothetical protein QDY71_03090 [Kingella negevensis]|uniref:Uncharacterized protein n=1 Tax=Kingella negevensis TaxID=1522312 RepID=A0A238HIH7_9NEIS|nr:hypothetical protein [Kingella negevensis]MDK4685538.1 hypothetical protein [Kingella negevensis]MDK4696762.1 hypothetical protein [Kingella negevensis]MDK4707947.1 hypothetical protein [Kingella negevensis]MDK4709465.1 hypothetical protein [Kingella negevensis]SNB81782.1 Uncharacterised protein [Kingella negevensis]
MAKKVKVKVKEEPTLSELWRREIAFKCWLKDIPNILDGFISRMPKEVADKLDFSMESLDVVEKYLLDNYENNKQIMFEEPFYILEGYAVYVGETFRKIIASHDPHMCWQLMLEEDNVYYSLPILDGYNIIDCPLTMVTASLDRRTGIYISSILNSVLERYSQYN